jgi:NodT family efflux transporter outer membrane factor (OMF) lipoprotein
MTRVREIEWHDARTSLAAEVANAYISLRALQIRQSLEGNTRTSLLASAQMLRSLLQVGLASADEAGLLDASAAQSQSRWLLATAEADVLFKVLVELTDIDEQALRQMIATEQPALPAPRTFAVEAIPAQVLSERPDIRIAAQQVSAALESINASQARRYPSLSLLGSIGGTRSTGGVTLSNSSWSFGPSVSLPLFTGGRLQAEVEQSKARYDQALGQYQHTVRAAVREVEATMVRLGAGQPSERSLREAVDRYQAQFDAAQARLKVGSLNAIDFEVVRRSLIDSQLRLLDQRREQLANWIILYKAVGGQWVPYDASQS